MMEAETTLADSDAVLPLPFQERIISISGNGLEDSSEFSKLTTTLNDRETNNNNNNSRNGSESLVPARGEANAVSTVRVIIFFVLLVAAVGMSLLVFFYSRTDENQRFQTEFADYANLIIESYTDSIDNQLGALDSFGNAITSFVQHTNSSFPFVTVPNFALRSASIRVLSETVFFYLAMIVSDEQRTQWEEYSANNKNWLIEESNTEKLFREMQDKKFMAEERENVVDESFTAATFNEHIFNRLENGSRVIVPNGSGPYAPFWQGSPPEAFMTKLINMDIFTHTAVAKTARWCFESKKAVFNVARLPYDTRSYNIFLQNGQFRYNKVQFLDDPSITIAYPVFSDFGPNKTVTGIFFMNIYFSLYLLNILPATAHGIHVVIENNMDQTLTYQVDGSAATFVGPGDHHDAGYDHMGVSQSVVEYLQQQHSPERSSYTVVDVDGDYAQYTIKIYPSAATEDVFLSNEPLLGAVIVSLVFVLTSGVFLFYDRLVKQRQDVVMRRALTSGVILSSFVSQNIQDTLIVEETTPQNDEQKQEIEPNPEWLSADDDKNVMNAADSLDCISSESLETKLIAQVYPATTILFAGLAGFAAWSSTKKPHDIFRLLETVYNVFDKISEKCGVYKIQIIEDCYVAVTGLPKPQQNHAVIMARFASECMHRFHDITHKLKESLGEEITNLQVRVGLHSGEVTAGILSGQNSRFQLFGSSMETASCMERNGVNGRIHASQTTADELVAKGKSHWLLLREEKILVKCKGEMQTYFVQVKNNCFQFSLAMVS